MPSELKVPTVGESITEVQIANWRVAEGDYIRVDSTVVELETDKATVELPAPVGGIVIKILKKAGETASVGDVIGMIEPSDGPSRAGGGQQSAAASNGSGGSSATKSASADQKSVSADQAGGGPGSSSGDGGAIMPAASRLLAEHGLKAEQVPATGPGGRLLKEDVERYVQSGKNQSQPAAGSSGAGSSSGGASGGSSSGGSHLPSRSPAPGGGSTGGGSTGGGSTGGGSTGSRSAAGSGSSGGSSGSGSGTLSAAVVGQRSTKTVAMSPIRKRIGQRLVHAQQSAALLTTFNEIDMAPIMALRKQYQDVFTKKYNVKLGFMSFFVKAVVDALNEFPQVGAQIQGDELVYQNYCDIGIAVGGGKGLVVPILRNAECLSFADIEVKIAEYAVRARDNKIGLEELQGGTFTITNGGIYGSLLSTPIVNPPQSGVLGMHNIVDRPVAVNGQVVIRPMMYVAMTYDHRVIDGREAVTFLKRIKDAIEDPTRMLLEV